MTLKGGHTTPYGFLAGVHAVITHFFSRILKGVPTMTILATRIKEIRVNRRETLEEFANSIQQKTGNRIKTTKSNVSKWEKGLNVPNAIALEAIANLGLISTDELLEKNLVTIPKEEYDRLKSIEEMLIDIKSVFERS